jgi:hypothetical protein
LQLLRAPEIELDVEFDRKSDAAPDLLTHRGHVAIGVAHEHFCHRGKQRRVLADRSRPGRFVDEGRAAFDRGRGIGEVVRNRLKRADRLPELLAGLGVFDGHLECGLRTARSLRCRQDDGVVHDALPRRPARSRRSDPVHTRHMHSIEVHAIGGLGAEVQAL